MAKIYGTLWPDESNDGSKKPDFKGSIKVGGVKGHNADQRNDDAAKFLRNLSRDFKENEEEGTWMSIAGWNRTNDKGDGFISIVLEDNEWRKANMKSNSKNNNSKSATENLDW